MASGYGIGQIAQDASGRLVGATQSTVASELDQLARAVDDLEKTVAIFTERTASIIYTPPQAGGKDMAVPPDVEMCALGDMIRVQRKRVNGLSKQIMARLDEFQI